MQLTHAHLLPLLALGHALTDADFYGQSPPVYPARKYFSSLLLPGPRLTRFSTSLQPMPKASAAGRPPSPPRRPSSAR